jgi:hypothetical protein
MLRLTANPSDHGFVYTLAKSGALVVSTGNREGLADRMLQIGIEEPARLIEAAEKWGVVEIREKGRRTRTGEAAGTRQTAPSRPATRPDHQSSTIALTSWRS